MPLIIREQQLKEAKLNKQKKLLRLENKYVLSLALMECNGFNMDTQHWMKTNEMVGEEINSMVEILDKESPDVNWNSSKQVIEVFKKKGIPTKVLDEAKSTIKQKVYKDSISAKNIKKYSKVFNLVDKVLKYKEMFKLYSSYGEKYLSNVHPVTGRIHSEFFQILNTGRQASSRPNLQQIPTGKPGTVEARFRQAFRTPPNRKLVVSDYSGQESRIIAELSSEPSMLDLFNNGNGDIHSLVASKLLGRPVTKKDVEDRQIGKITNFTITYGGGPKTIAERNPGVSLKEAKKLIETFFKMFPHLKEYYDTTIYNTLKNGYIELDKILHRRFYLDSYEEYRELLELKNRFKKRGWLVPRTFQYRLRKLENEMSRKSMNYPIQSIAASMTKLAAVYFTDWVIKRNLLDQVKIVNCVHDEIVIDTDTELADRVSKKIEDCMKKAGRYFVKQTVMVANPVISNYWTH